MWIKCKCYLPDGEIRTDHTRRALSVGDPVGFDEEAFVVVRVREDGDGYDVMPHPRAKAFVEAMLDPSVEHAEAMKRAWEIGKLTPEQVTKLVAGEPIDEPPLDLRITSDGLARLTPSGDEPA